MAEITFSAVPFNGGAVSLGSNNSHFVRLTDARYLLVYQQTGPQYTIGAVVELGNAKTTTPTATTLRQQVLPNMNYGPNNGQAIVRLVKLTDTRVLIVRNDALDSTKWLMNVLEIDPTTNVITIKLSTDAVYLATGGPSAIFGAFGAGFVCSQLEDNKAVVATRTSGSNTIVTKVTYNPGSNTLTLLNLNAGFAVSNTSWAAHNLSVVKVPTGGVVITSAANNAAATPTYIINKAYFVNGDSTSLTTIVESAGIVGDNCRKNYVPFTATTGVFTDGVYFQHFNNGSLGQVVAISGGPLGPTFHTTMDALYINSDYFACLSISPGSQSNSELSGNEVRAFRVVKYTDPNYAIVSPATVGNSTYKGINIGSFALTFPDSPMMDLVDPNLIVIVGLSSVSAFAFKTLWLS